MKVSKLSQIRIEINNNRQEVQRLINSGASVSSIQSKVRILEAEHEELLIEEQKHVKQTPK